MKTFSKSGAAAVAVALTSVLYGCGGATPGLTPSTLTSTTANGGLQSVLGNLSVGMQFPMNQAGQFRSKGRAAGIQPAGSKWNIPLGAASVKVRVTDTTGTTDLAQAVIVTPGTNGNATATFSNIPAGPVLVIIEAHSDLAGTSAPMATGSTPVTVVAGQVAQVTVQFDAPTIGIGIFATPAGAQPYPLAIDSTVALQALVTNGATALTGYPLTWSSNNSAVATVTQSATDPSSATVTGISPGSAIIEVREPNSGVFTDFDVTVTGGG